MPATGLDKLGIALLRMPLDVEEVRAGREDLIERDDPGGLLVLGGGRAEARRVMLGDLG